MTEKNPERSMPKTLMAEWLKTACTISGSVQIKVYIAMILKPILLPVFPTLVPFGLQGMNFSALNQIPLSVLIIYILLRKKLSQRLHPQTPLVLDFHTLFLMSIQTVYGYYVAIPAAMEDHLVVGYYRFHWLPAKNNIMDGTAIKIFPAIIMVRKRCVMTETEIASG